MTADLLQNAADYWPILTLILLASVLHRRENYPFERLCELVLAVVPLASMLCRRANRPLERLCELILAWWKR